jgi:condensin complex subunit 1
MQILAEHQAKGLEEQALEADVAKKTKAAKRRAAKRGAAGASIAAPVASRETEVETPVKNERPKRGKLKSWS